MTTPAGATGTDGPTRASTAGVVTTTVAATTGLPAVARTVADTVAAGDGATELAYTGATSPVVPVGFALLLLLAGAGTLLLRRRHSGVGTDGQR